MSENYQTQLKEHGAISIVPRGNSMWPILKHKGQSVIIGVKKERLKKYDVGFFLRPDGSPVLHRVMDVFEDGYQFIGDSQLYTEFVKEEQVIGVMLGYYKGEQYIDCNDKKYQKRVSKYYAHPKLRKIKCNNFFRYQNLKRKIKNLFCKKGK